MKRTITSIALAAAILAPAAASAGTSTEKSTRHAAGIPAAAKYIKGSGVVIAPGVKCYSAKAKLAVKVLGHRVPKGHRIGYCTDGFVDRSTSLGAVVIRSAR